MRASPFSLSLIAAAVAGFSFPYLVDTIEQRIGTEQVREKVDAPLDDAVARKALPDIDMPAPTYPLLLANSVIPQAVSEMPVSEMPVEMPATNSGPVAGAEKTELPTQARTAAKVWTKVVTRAGTPTQMLPKPPRRPQFQADGVGEGPIPAISQLFESAHRELERVAATIRTL